MNEIEIVTAEQANALERKTLEWVAKGWDVYGPVLTCESAIGQLIVRHASAPAEYRMVIADNFADFKRDVRSLIGDGFEMHYSASTWNGVIMQWMVRYGIDLTGDIVRGASARVSALEDIITPTGRFTFVDRIERTLQLIPSILPGGKPLVVEGGRVLVESPSET